MRTQWPAYLKNSEVTQSEYAGSRLMPEIIQRVCTCLHQKLLQAGRQPIPPSQPIAPGGAMCIAVPQLARVCPSLLIRTGCPAAMKGRTQRTYQLHLLRSSILRIHECLRMLKLCNL